MDTESHVPNSPKPGDTFFVRMNNGSVRKLRVIRSVSHHGIRLDAAEVLEARPIDGTDQQEYFVHYLNRKYARAQCRIETSGSFLVDHRNDQWITESRLSANVGSEQIESSTDQLNDSMCSLSGRKRARLKRRLNDVDYDELPDSSILQPDCIF